LQAGAMLNAEEQELISPEEREILESCKKNHS
jgi:hypothetical protein